MDFLLLLIELFSIGVTAEALRAKNRLKIGVFEGTGSVWPKISGTRGHPLPTILRVRKLDESVFHTV